MGRAARANLRSPDGEKWPAVVTQARIERAPVSTLIKTLVAMLAPAVAEHLQLRDQHGRPIARRDLWDHDTVRVRLDG